tara:strand:- start:425 stop:1225 length:801 start_codon:yes stop_codon:yes gene_type:complete
MICYPNAKINLGLKILSKREDGFHNISSFFYPIPLFDILEVIKDNSLHNNQITYSGIQFPNTENDLVIKAYQVLNDDYPLQPVKIHLHKNIPHGSGLGGGSSNSTFMLMLLNSLFNLKLSHFDLLKYAKKLGSDCSFFLYNKPSYVSGLGEKISSIQLDLSGLYIVVVKPNISCSTKEVFSKFKINSTSNSLDFSEKIELSINKHMNDLEAITFSLYPELKEIKTYLISLGAVYASMSGSGSSIFGLFKTKPIVKDINAWIWIKKL